MNKTKYGTCPICLERVNYQISNNHILKEISVEIEKDKITGIIGPSGSGKSTLLRIINRLISPSSGTLRFEGQKYEEISTRQLRKQIGLVQQRPFLFPGTVYDNLRYGPMIWSILYSEKDYKELLEKVALPGDFLHRDIAFLSGGEQQRVSLTRSLANKPHILLLDEPTSGLDVVSEEIFETTLKDLSKEGIKIIIVTHSLEQTKRLTEQLLFLRNGFLIEKTSTSKFFEENSDEEIRGFFKGKEVKR